MASSPIARPSRVRLLLVGVGHAHLEVLRRLALRPLPGVELTVVSPGPRHHYSGMVPGYLQGFYTEEEIAVPVAPLVAWAGGRLVLGAAVALDPPARTVRVERTEGEAGAATVELAYDWVSFAVGSNTAGLDDARIAGHVERVKPIGRVVRLRERLRALAAAGGEAAPVPAAIVGGGAAGVELALAAAAVFERAGRPHRLALLESGDDLLAGYSARLRRRARRILADRGIALRTRTRVTAVDGEALALGDGSRLPSQLTVWATGPVAWSLFRGSGLPLDERGFLLVDRALRSLGDPRIFAAGDCGTLADHPRTPKAGVYAVREGPVLAANLRAAITGGRLADYHPQSGFLSILNTADGRALLRYGPFVTHGRLAFRLKDWIDRRFLARYD